MVVNSIVGHVVELYDSLESVPMLSLHKYNKFCFIESGVGSDLADVSRHISRIKGFIKTDVDSANKELDNLEQNIYFVIQEMDPKALAFAALIKKVDGKEVYDKTDSGLQALSTLINNTPSGVFFKLFEELKKKFQTK